MTGSLDARSVDTIRFLSVDMVEAARSGHPGLPLGAAPMTYVLWQRFLRHSPRHPRWADRNGSSFPRGTARRSCTPCSTSPATTCRWRSSVASGNGGAALPAIPESGVTAGVEVTTGPLGQGFAMGVGMAIAERFLAETFNREGARVIDHRTYGLISDGDLMEGISAEAASLAATMGLGKLVYLYDANRVSLEEAPSSPSPRMSARAFAATAGRSSTCRTATTSARSTAPCARASSTAVGPT